MAGRFSRRVRLECGSPRGSGGDGPSLGILLREQELRRLRPRMWCGGGCGDDGAELL